MTALRVKQIVLRLSRFKWVQKAKPTMAEGTMQGQGDFSAVRRGKRTGDRLSFLTDIFGSSRSIIWRTTWVRECLWHKCLCCESSFVHNFYCCFLYVNAARQQKKTANPPNAA